MKQLEIKPLRFGLKYANEEVVSSKQLQAENKLLEEKVNQLKKIIEDDHKKTEERRIKEKEQPKSFRTREIKIRGSCPLILRLRQRDPRDAEEGEPTHKDLDKEEGPQSLRRAAEGAENSPWTI